MTRTRTRRHAACPDPGHIRHIGNEEAVCGVMGDVLNGWKSMTGGYFLHQAIGTNLPIELEGNQGHRRFPFLRLTL